MVAAKNAVLAITVQNTTIGNEVVQSVNSRDLYFQLEVKKDYSNWIKDRIEKYGFVDGEDYTPILANRSDGRKGKRRRDYILTLDTAKEIAMVENNEQGRNIRKYLIQIEKEFKKGRSEYTIATQLRVLANDIEKMQLKMWEQDKNYLDAYEVIKHLDNLLDNQKPVIEAHKQLTEANGFMNMVKAGSLFGMSDIALFKWLRDNKYLNKDNIPYVNHIQRGLFRTITTTYFVKGNSRVHVQTLISMKGVDRIRQFIAQDSKSLVLA